MTKLFTTAIAASLVFVAGAEAAPAMKAGLWEVTNNIETAGTNAKRTVTGLVCITADDLKNPSRLIPPQTEAGMPCSTKDVKVQGDSYIWHVSCTGKAGTMTGTGTMTPKGDIYTATSSLELKAADAKAADKPGKVTEKFTAKRTGDCK
jgi:hypothetical protein